MGNGSLVAGYVTPRVEPVAAFGEFPLVRRCEEHGRFVPGAQGRSQTTCAAELAAPQVRLGSGRLKPLPRSSARTSLGAESHLSGGVRQDAALTSRLTSARRLVSRRDSPVNCPSPLT